MEMMIRRRVKMMMIVIIMLIMMMMVTMTMTNILVIWVATTPSEMAPQCELQRPNDLSELRNSQLHVKSC